MNLHNFPTKEEAVASCGESLNNLLLENLKTPVLLLLSSGSALEILNYISSSCLSENLTITMLDERFSEDPKINNFIKLQKTEFYELAQSADVNFIGTLPRPKENMEDMRVRLELAVRNWIQNNPQGKIFATFGMGKDGHTAGIFPYPENPKLFEDAFENSHYFSAYDCKGKNEHPLRITATLSFFRLIDTGFMLVCGKEKELKFKELVAGQSQPHILPAVGIFETKNYQIYTDIAIK